MIVLPHLFSPFFRQFPKSEGRILSGTMIPPLNKAASNSKVSTLLVGDKQCGNIHAFLKIEKKTESFYNIHHGLSIIASKVRQIISVMKT